MSECSDVNEKKENRGRKKEKRDFQKSKKSTITPVITSSGKVR